jgi:RNA polymerase sigma factor (sigma-70 family)
VQVEEHLFRRESGRMVTALTRIFGLDNLALVEDVVQDAFCRALEVWKFRGVPDNPSAWLLTTAKNRAIDLLRRDRRTRTLVPELGRLLESEWTLVPTVGEFFNPATIQDDQLRMMFSCCDPNLSEAAQIALILNLLCGFTASEIASAFLSGRAAIEKRIARGKKVLAASKALFDLTDAEFAVRLSAVQRALYLLFNEGYHGASARSAVRVELCREAMRLARLLLEHPLAATPATYALCALMWLDAARLPGRVDTAGHLSTLLDQDRSRWDVQLIVQGTAFLERSARGPELTEYHLEAAIASLHSSARQPEETDWKKIVGLYDALMAIRPSPVVALNRAIAVAQSEGPERGLEELHAIADSDRLARYPFYPAALGELELRRGRRDAARGHFQTALALARNPMERDFLELRAGAAADI